MINALIVVGKNIKYNQIFVEYVERKVCEKIGHLDMIYHLDKNDSDLFISLEEVILKSKRVVIVTRDAFSFVSKIISTLTDDNMVLRKGILAPSKAIEYHHDSYLLQHEGKAINILKVTEHETLPPIMIETQQKSVSFYLVDATSTLDHEKLENIVKINDVTISETSIVEGLVFVKAYGFKHEQYDGFVQSLAFAFEDKIVFGEDLAKIIAQRLMESNKYVTCAESCTGGLLASEIVKNAGVSAIFNGSIVSYADAIKTASLSVSRSTLKTYGAVSAQTVYSMLVGAMNLMKSDMAIAVSGIAGPTGGSKEKPVGTVYVGAKSKGSEAYIEKLSLKGDRIYIQKQAMFWGLKLLLLSDKKTFFNFLPKKLDN